MKISRTTSIFDVRGPLVSEATSGCETCDEILRAMVGQSDTTTQELSQSLNLPQSTIGYHLKHHLLIDCYVEVVPVRRKGRTVLGWQLKQPGMDLTISFKKNSRETTVNAHNMRELTIKVRQPIVLEASKVQSSSGGFLFPGTTVLRFVPKYSPGSLNPSIATQ